MAGPSVLDSIGGEIVGVMSPVSVCMLAVVALVSSLTATSPTRTVASLVYLETASDSTATKLEGALLNAVVVVALIAAVTFVVVVLYYLNFTSFLSAYLRFSVFTVLAAMGGSVFLALIQAFSVTVDAVTCFVLLFNFTAVGVVSVFSAVPILLRQSYMVSLGVFFAASLTRLPEWSTWVLLAALAVYDVAAVLVPGGPLKLLVEIASRRGGDLPALVYEARPRARVNSDDPGSVELHGGYIVDREVPPAVRVSGSDASPENQDASDHGYIVQGVPPPVTNSMGRASGSDASEIRVEEDTSPLVEAEAEREEAMQVMRPNAEDTEMFETRGIQLGLGDFIFYSVLVGRAAMYDLMTVYACYLAIISGLGCTLVLLSICRRALPALPISITLGIMFYFLTRLLMEPFVVGVMTNLMMF